MKQCESLPLYSTYDKVSFFSRHHLNRRLLLEKKNLNKTKHFLEEYSICNPKNNNIFKQVVTCSLHKTKSSSLDELITNQINNNKNINNSNPKKIHLQIKKKSPRFLKTQSVDENTNSIIINDDNIESDKFGRRKNNEIITKIKTKMFFMKDTLNYIYPKVHDIRQKERIKDKKRWSKNKLNNNSYDNKNRQFYTCQNSPKASEPSSKINIKLIKRNKLPKITMIPLYKQSVMK